MSAGSGSTVSISDSQGRAVESTEHGEIKTSTLSVIFYDQVEGTTINTNTWAPSQDTMTQAQAGAGFTSSCGCRTARRRRCWCSAALSWSTGSSNR